MPGRSGSPPPAIPCPSSPWTRVPRPWPADGMDHHPGRLVHHEQAVVLVGDRQVLLLRLERRRLPFAHVDRDELAAGETVALRANGPVDQHPRRRDQALGLGSRADRLGFGEKPIEPLAHRGGRHGELEHQGATRDAGPEQGQRSPKMKTASRMITPTVMKTSPRLKAGQ